MMFKLIQSPKVNIPLLPLTHHPQVSLSPTLLRPILQVPTACVRPTGSSHTTVRTMKYRPVLSLSGLS
jgi:hypothetical protein